MIVRFIPMIAGLALFTLLVEPAFAAPPSRSALVLEKSGTLTPDVKPFSEIKAGTVVALESGSRLKFLHYPTCTTVVVSKGSVRFGEKEYEVVGAKPDSATAASCPRRVTLKNVGEVGAGHLRATDGKGLTPLTLTPKPEFVLVGERADEYATLRIMTAEKPVLEAPMLGPKFEWPKEAPPLKPHTTYEFLLVPKTLGVGKVKKRFRVEESTTGDGGPAALFVIDLD
jgi:hypothetical protein